MVSRRSRGQYYRNCDDQMAILLPAERCELPNTFDRDLTVKGVNIGEQRETRDPGIWLKKAPFGTAVNNTELWKLTPNQLACNQEGCLETRLSTA